MTDSSLYPYISKPGRYLGHEYNSIKKNWQDATCTTALIFPDLYEIGMSHQGLQILYHLINKEDSFIAERCYCPSKDIEELLRQKQQPLTSLESAKPLKYFDMLGITLPYELCYTNILTILDLANIPFMAAGRDLSYPLLLAGGAGAFNPEPVAELFDAILIGDGEEAMVEVAELIAKSKNNRQDKQAFLSQLSKIDGIYIPSHFEPIYSDAGKLTEIKSLTEKESVLRRFLTDFERIDHLEKPIVPNAKIVHDRLGIEIARGCTRGCRFCQAGITYRPVRERSAKQIKKLATKAIDDSGFDELALLSLSTGDYSCLEQILPDLMNEFSDQYVSVAMPSMRVGTLSQPIMDQIKRVRKTGFTLAPEAGSERLRQVINKGITEEALLDTCRDAFSLGWTVMKLYFMIGLPTETDEDLEAISELVNKVRRFRDAGGNVRKSQVKVSVGTFVPKPHTPFQWASQLTLEESKRRLFLLKSIVPKKGCNLNYHNPLMSFMEGVFSRGDRKLLPLLIEAWKLGVRLDGWTEHFSFKTWEQAAANIDLDMDSYLVGYDLNDTLPWQHIDTGVTTDFLKAELQKSSTGTYTPDCRYHKCHKCGVCDFETIHPIVHNKKKFTEFDDTPHPTIDLPKELDDKRQAHFKYMVRYSRKGNICYLGHLEILQVVFRALRRAGIETNYSQGFNPSPKVSFGPALSVGTESLAEYFIMDLIEPLKDLPKAIQLLSDNLPPGLSVIDVKLHSGEIPQNIETTYEVTVPIALSSEQQTLITSFLEKDEFNWARYRKGKKKTINIRPLIKTIDLLDKNKIRMTVKNCAGQAGIKPQEFTKILFNLSDDELLQIKTFKLDWHPINE